MLSRGERVCCSTRDAMEVDINVYTYGPVLFDVIGTVLLRQLGVETGWQRRCCSLVGPHASTLPSKASGNRESILTGRR